MFTNTTNVEYMQHRIRIDLKNNHELHELATYREISETVSKDCLATELKRSINNNNNF